MIKLPKLILASGSPRRAEILTSVGWEFTKSVADVDESELSGETPENYVQRLALEKAEAVAGNHPNDIVLGADTTVVIDNQIIGKPVDITDAQRMLKVLSGNWHEVLTGVALVKKSVPSALADGVNANYSNVEANPPAHAGGSDLQIVGFERTRVKFAVMSEKEIEFLAEIGEPLDKAGAYAVQAQAALFIEKIEGDYWNVVGLPVHLVYELTNKISRKEKG